MGCEGSEMERSLTLGSIDRRPHAIGREGKRVQRTVGPSQSMGFVAPELGQRLHATLTSGAINEVADDDQQELAF